MEINTTCNKTPEANVTFPDDLPFSLSVEQNLLTPGNWTRGFSCKSGYHVTEGSQNKFKEKKQSIQLIFASNEFFCSFGSNKSFFGGNYHYTCNTPEANVTFPDDLPFSLSVEQNLLTPGN